MKQILVLLGIVGLSLAAVEGITSEQLTEIQASPKIWLVYQASDQSNPKIKVLDDVSEVLTGFYRIGTIAGQSESLKFYADDGAVHQFNGNFEVDEIVNWALENTNGVLEARSKVAKDIKANKEFLTKEAERANQQWNDEQALRVKSDVVVVGSNTWDSAFLKERIPVLMNVYEANCSACIEMNREWEAVATAYKGSVKVIKINITEAEDLEKWIQQQTYPSIRFYAAGNKKVEQFERYSGIKKQFSIREWANAKLTEVKDSVDIPELNKENYQTLCKSTKATCVIVFTENLADVSAKIGELGAKYLKKPISFLVAKKGSQPAFEKQAGVDQFPNTVMMYCARKKMLKMDSLDFTTIDEVINEITLGNRNNFVKYKFEEELV